MRDASQGQHARAEGARAVAAGGHERRLRRHHVRPRLRRRRAAGEQRQEARRDERARRHAESVPVNHPGPGPAPRRSVPGR